MVKKQFHYLVRLQYLGFRYSGWQIQPGQRTVEGMVMKTLRFILPDLDVKILASGRTDAKVSALDAVFELFLSAKPLLELDKFMESFNTNLPPDIRVTAIEPITSDINIIQDIKRKEYIYLFSYGVKNHPFSAPFMANILEELNIDFMKQGANLFEGEHDFSSYTAELKPNTTVFRSIDSCYIEENTILKANFFPKNSYMLRVVGGGFMRYQIRMIMGALIELGKGKLSFNQLIDSLEPNNHMLLKTIAPGSGLILNEVNFNQT